LIFSCLIQRFLVHLNSVRYQLLML
jgi:hypothetical protein